MFFGKTMFSVLQYRTSVLKKTSISGSFFEPCSSRVAVDMFFQKKNGFLEKTQINVILMHFLTIFVQVPQCHFFWGGDGGGEIQTFHPRRLQKNPS